MARIEVRALDTETAVIEAETGNGIVGNGPGDDRNNPVGHLYLTRRMRTGSPTS